MSKRITSGSSKASSASDEAFGRLKNWAERIDEEIARLESEARRKMMTCSFDDKNGLPAPICDTIRDNVEEMSQMVQAMKREIGDRRQELRQEIGEAIHVHDKMREDYRKVSHHAAQYGLQLTEDDERFMADKLTFEGLEKEVLEAKAAAAVDEPTKGEQKCGHGKVKSPPSLLETGISKGTLQSMGIHFGREEAQTEQRFKPSTSVLSPRAVSRFLDVSITRSPVKRLETVQSSDDDDDFSPATSILKTSNANATTVPDVSMEASRVEISPGLKVKRTKPKVATTASIKAIPPPVPPMRNSSTTSTDNESNQSIPEFTTENVQKYLTQFNSVKPPPESSGKKVAPESSLWASPELPILKTMDLSKLYKEYQATKTGTAAPRASSTRPSQDPSVKENSPVKVNMPTTVAESPEGKDEIMAILKKYSVKPVTSEELDKHSGKKVFDRLVKEQERKAKVQEPTEAEEDEIKAIMSKYPRSGAASARALSPTSDEMKEILNRY